LKNIYPSRGANTEKGKRKQGNGERQGRQENKKMKIKQKAGNM
jgi:hypothetical protein